MKNLLLFLFPLFLFSQEGETKSVWIHNVLAPHVKTFVQEGLKRGFDARPFILQLDSIRLSKTLAENEMGLYTPRVIRDSIGTPIELVGNVDISVDTRIDYLILRHTVYHELAHACGYFKHSCYRCYDIMSAVQPKNFTYAIYYEEEVWSKYLDQLFTQIKLNLEEYEKTLEDLNIP